MLHLPEPSDRPSRRTALIARELSRYDADIAALSETSSLAELDGGYTFLWKGYPPSQNRLHGVGSAVVNGLSKWVKLEIKKNGKVHQLHFDHGVAKESLQEVGELENPKDTGTSVTFKPDNEIFEVHEFNYDTLVNRFREMAFLNKGLSISIKDERNEKKETFCYEGGLVQFVEYLNRT